jgi:hypothetical protein
MNFIKKESPAAQGRRGSSIILRRVQLAETDPVEVAIIVMTCS